MTDDTTGYKPHLGDVDPGFKEWTKTNFLYHEGEATVYRKGDSFQAVYDSEKLYIVAKPEPDITDAIEGLEVLIKHARHIGDDDVKSILPKLKESI